VYDAIVVGARCAGATTALLLARAGHRVLLVDRAKFPRDTLSSLYIEPRGVALLESWGLLDDLVATGTPALDRIGPTALPRPAYAPRRTVLDEVIVRAAVAAGVEFQDGCTVTGLEFQGNRVVGVRRRTRGAEIVLRARLVVGADGMRSGIAAAVRASMLVNDAPRTCVYYSFFTGAAKSIELYATPGRWVSTLLTNDGVTLVQAYWPQATYASVRADVPGAFAAAVQSVAPDLWERMSGRQVDRFHGSGDQRNFFRTAAGPGWVLVGDAGHHSDAITAHGITHAFLQSALLTDLLPADLADEAAVRMAMDLFAVHRDTALLDDYRHTLAVAALSGAEVAGPTTAWAS
jgi:flavin-dependent dehydrogenase